MEKPLIIYSTFPDAVTAEDVGREIVATRLAACINILPGMTSIYAWQGRVEKAAEVVVIFKSRAGLCNRLMARIKELHPYETPVIMALDVADIDGDTLVWLLTETSGEAGSEKSPQRL